MTVAVEMLRTHGHWSKGTVQKLKPHIARALCGDADDGVPYARMAAEYAPGEFATIPMVEQCDDYRELQKMASGLDLPAGGGKDEVREVLLEHLRGLANG